MKIQKKRQFTVPKKAIIAAGTILILGSLSLLALYLFHKNQTPTPATQVKPTNTVNYNSPTSTEKQQNSDLKSAVIQQDAQKQSNTNTTPSNIQITITRASQASAGQPLSIRAIIERATTGTCTMSLTKSGETTITKNASITAQATYTSCDPVDINASEFGSNGQWLLTLTAQSGSQTKSITQNVTVTK